MPVAEDSDQHLRVVGRVSPSDADHSSSTAHLRDGSRTSSPDDPNQSTARTHLSTRFLRKSASADSCIGQRSPTQSQALTDETQRDNALPSLDEPSSPQPERADTRALSSPPSVMSLSGYLRSKVGRKRGATNATMTDNETSAQEDSDLDKQNTTSGTVKERVRARLLSLKSSKAPTPAPQESRAPSLPARDASTSLSNLKASSPVTSKVARKSTTSYMSEPVPSRMTTRARSHSVGPPSKTSTSRMAKRLSFGNQTPKPEMLREISIAVVGTPGCGKSTFIRKALRKHDLSNLESLTANVAAEGRARSVSYTRRTAPFLGFSADTTLSVYEYDSGNLKINDGTSVLPFWPAELPRPDGIFVCYDASDRTSFADVVQLVSRFRSIGIPSLVIACKSDLEKRVHPEDAAIAVDPYSKLIEVSCHSDDGKRRMRKAVDWLIKKIVTSKSPSPVPDFSRAVHQGVSHAEPRSQKLEKLERVKNLTLAVQTNIPRSPIDLSSPSTPPVPPIGPRPLSRSKSSSSPSSFAGRSPTKACSMNDMRTGHHQLRIASPCEVDKENLTRKSLTNSISFLTKSTDSFVDIPGATPKRFSTQVENVAITAVCGDHSDKEKQKSRAPIPWVTLDELLEKVFFLAISGDDPSFVAHFFLTYRRFATPRSVLLGMQKRLNELRKPTSDPVLACFAQMRICNLLEQWMREYPSDFAVPGTHGALQAVTRHVLSYTHTLSYGGDFLPFIEMLGSLTDEDASWGLRPTMSSVSDSDTEVDSMFDTELNTVDTEGPELLRSSPSEPSRSAGSASPSSPRFSTRDRRSSLPLSAMARLKAPILNALASMEDQSGPSPKEVISKLQRTAAALYNYEPESIANEITRRELELFLKIKPRDWLRHTLVPGKKDLKTDPIAKFNAHYNDLHEWAVSLILCHDKPKGRARQIEKFAEVATKLRMLNNYSGLRALITAINQATYPGDQPMEMFRTKVDLHKKYLSSDILLRTTGAHQSYRMALRNTKGPCIPSLEVHTSDLRRAHEGNSDTKPDEPNKINWAKYHMMGRFIETTTSIQQRCVGPSGYKFIENKYLAQLFDVPVMDYEMQQSRMAQPPDDDMSNVLNSSTSFIGSHSKESSVIKRILPW